MHPLDTETHDPRTILRPEQAHRIDLRQSLSRPGHQGGFVRVDRLQPDALDIIDRRMQPEHADDMRRSCLEPARRRCIGRLGERDPIDHRAAALIGWHLIKQIGSTPQDADPGRSVQFVSGKDVEVAADVGDIQGHTWHCLTPIEQDLRADGMRDFSCTLRIEHRAQHVRYMSKRDQLVGRRDHRRHRVEIDAVIGGQRNHIDCRTHALRDHLPRHDVAMMLEHGQKDAVTCLELRSRPALSDEIDPLGRAAHKHDFVGRHGSHEPGDPLARSLIGQRHVGRALVHPAMDGGIGCIITARDRIDDRLRLLRSGRCIEIRPAGRDRREVGQHVERAGFERVDHRDPSRKLRRTLPTLTRPHRFSTLEIAGIMAER